MKIGPWLFLLYLFIKSWCIAAMASGMILWIHGRGISKVFATFSMSAGFMGLLEFGAMAWDRSLGHEFGHRTTPALLTYWVGHAVLCLNSWLLLGYFIWRKNGTRG